MGTVCDDTSVEVAAAARTEPVPVAPPPLEVNTNPPLPGCGVGGVPAGFTFKNSWYTSGESTTSLDVIWIEPA